MTHVDTAGKSHGRSKAAATPQQPQTREAPAPPAVAPKERQHAVAIAAYFRAEHRGFVPGHELQDWLDAEAEFDMPRAQSVSPPG